MWERCSDGGQSRRGAWGHSGGTSGGPGIGLDFSGGR